LRLIFAQNLRTIPASAEEQSLKFSVQVLWTKQQQVRTISKVYFASCLFTYNC